MPKKSRYNEALAEMSRKAPNLASVFEDLQTADRQGDLRATYAIGTWYLHGRFVTKDKRHGLALIRRAAEGAVPSALFDYAVALESGDGVRRAPSKAAACYLRAALLGDQQATFETGRCLYYGIGFRQDRKLARVFLEAAEAQKPSLQQIKKPSRQQIKGPTKRRQLKVR
jgi:TPR repeat protein